MLDKLYTGFQTKNITFLWYKIVIKNLDFLTLKSLRFFVNYVILHFWNISFLVFKVFEL